MQAATFSCQQQEATHDRLSEQVWQPEASPGSWTCKSSGAPLKGPVVIFKACPFLSPLGSRTFSTKACFVLFCFVALKASVWKEL